MNESQWTIEIPAVDAEYLPHGMTFRLKRQELDFFRAEFDVAVGEDLKPHTQAPGDALHGRHRCLVKLDGAPVRMMLFNSDGVVYGDQSTQIKLYDLQNALDSGIVDKQWDNVTLREAYEYAFEQRDDSGLVEGLTFNIPDELEDINLVSVGGPTNIGRTMFDKWRIERDETRQLVDSNYAVDFDSISPFKSIWKLNNEYNLQSWTDTDGVLHIGVPESNPDYHIAAPDDERVWRYTNVSVAHPREPIQRVLVKGAWIDQPGYNVENNITEWFNPLAGDVESNQEDFVGSGDMRITGVAERTDVDHGVTFETKNADAKRDAVETVAKRALLEEMKQQNSGAVDIDPAISGEFTSFDTLSLGDYLHVVPTDEPFRDAGVSITDSTGEIGDTPDGYDTDWCGSVANNELYTIDGIQHNLGGSGHWTITINISLWPHDVTGNIGTSLLYFDPNRAADEQQYFTEDGATRNVLEST